MLTYKNKKNKWIEKIKQIVWNRKYCDLKSVADNTAEWKLWKFNHTCNS